MYKAGSFILLLVLAGCETTTPPEMIWVRTDGQSGAANPELQKQFQIDQSICNGRISGIAAGAAPVYFNGAAGAIAASNIVRQRDQALQQALIGCMAERGYVASTKAGASTVAQNLAAGRPAYAGEGEFPPTP